MSAAAVQPHLPSLIGAAAAAPSGDRPFIPGDLVTWDPTSQIARLNHPEAELGGSDFRMLMFLEDNEGIPALVVCTHDVTEWGQYEGMTLMFMEELVPAHPNDLRLLERQHRTAPEEKGGAETV